jgi:triacylglycerol lipase
VIVQSLILAICIPLTILSVSSKAKATETTENETLDQKFVELKEFAILADAAYQSETKIHSTNAIYGYKISDYAIVSEAEVAYFLATNNKKKTHIISIRGTTNNQNAIVDLALQLIFDPRAQVYLHSGFAQAAAEIYKKILPKLNNDYRIKTTGHSLGGAVALILAMYLDAERFNVERIVTFGQPKLTNIQGALKYDHLNITRVVTARDLVPLVPPFDPMDINNLDIYWHLGQELILHTGTQYSLLVGLDSMLRATNFLTHQLSEDYQRNHKMALYLKLIEQKVNGASLIPFKNEFSLFDLVERW